MDSQNPSPRKAETKGSLILLPQSIIGGVWTDGWTAQESRTVGALPEDWGFILSILAAAYNYL